MVDPVTKSLLARGEESVHRPCLFRVHRSDHLAMPDEYYTLPYLNNNHLNPMHLHSDLPRPHFRISQE